MKNNKQKKSLIPTHFPESFGGFLSLRDEIDRLFDDMLVPFSDTRDSDTLTLSPRVDVSETDTHVVVRADVPGIDPKDIAIEVTDDMVSLSGSVEREDAEKKESYYRVERQYGTFSRTFALPAAIDVENVDAETKDGVLTIKLKKEKTQKKKKVAVKVK